MHRLPSYRRVFITFCCTLITTAACAQSSSVPNIQSTRISGLWVLGQCQLRRHAGAEQQKCALANTGFHIRIARHDCDLLRGCRRE
jgi:hypothetical protein